MTISFKIFLTLFSLLGYAVGYAQNGKVLHLSLQEALRLANSKAYQIQIAKSELRQAEGKNLESWGGFLPRASISENYIKSNDAVTAFSLKLKQGIFSQQDFSLSTLNNPDAIDNYATLFQVQQPLLNLDAIYGKSAAKLGVKARQAALNRTEEAIALAVKKAYYGLILATEKRRAVDEAVQSATAHRDDARAAFEQGIINQADYLAAEVRLGELQEEGIIAEHQIANAGDGLKFVIGIEEESAVVPTDGLPAPANEPKKSESHDHERLAARSDLQALRFQSQAAQRNLWMTRSNWVPRLNAFGSVEWNSSQAFRQDGSSWALGLQLQWQFFDGLGTFGRSKRAAAEAEVVDVQVRQAQEKARLEARKAERAVAAAHKRIRVAQTAVEQAQEGQRIVEERFKEGLERASDLLDKETALTHAKLRLIKARHDYAIAVGELQFALGL